MRVHISFMDTSYSSCMPFNTIYSAHMAVLLQYIKPSESTLYLSKGSSKTTVLLPGANIKLTVSKSILSNIIYNYYYYNIIHIEVATDTNKSGTSLSV